MRTKRTRKSDWCWSQITVRCDWDVISWWRSCRYWCLVCDGILMFGNSHLSSIAVCCCCCCCFSNHSWWTGRWWKRIGFIERKGRVGCRCHCRQVIYGIRSYNWIIRFTQWRRRWLGIVTFVIVLINNCWGYILIAFAVNLCSFRLTFLVCRSQGRVGRAHYLFPIALR